MTFLCSFGIFKSAPLGAQQLPTPQQYFPAVNTTTCLYSYKKQTNKIYGPLELGTGHSGQFQRHLRPCLYTKNDISGRLKNKSCVLQFICYIVKPLYYEHKKNSELAFYFRRKLRKRCVTYGHFAIFLKFHFS